LDTEGSIAEQGHFDVLNATGGYVSSFNLGPPDWDYQKEEWQSSSMKEFHPSSHPIQTAQEIEAEANKRTGDISIYMYYMRAVGWIAILIFVVSITAFIFCISFPSEYLNFLSTFILELGIFANGFSSKVSG
jgi:ATP-binding cassette subfamily C (CFTR/MRP) protein 1